MRFRFGRLFIACGCLLLSGCFEAVYEQRLKTANEHFKHQEILDSNLGPVWFGTGLAFRVPKEFELIPPPEAPAAEGDGAAEATPQIDRRQPDFIGMELPGLVGAWKANVTVSGQSASAYAYIMTNQALMAMPPGPDRPNPAEFTNKTIEDLSRAAKISLKPEDWINESFPKQSGFITPVNYQSAVQESTREVAGKKMRYLIYRSQQGDLQAIVMFVIPSNTSDPIIDKLPI
ncbi:MAG: hypothetical protein KDA36_11245, partial [Planctomycetaceae bacterium]|nr:hypothetical protein [Planctomycetaceae bacterium]